MKFKFRATCGKIVAAIILFSFKGFSQVPDSLKEVSLPAVIIKAFEQNRKLKDVPASVSYIGRQMFENFSGASIVSAINTTAGVRMEERSPGSYRLNIRGSSLRSPFGVRNVKIYYNDIPFTDPGGQSYLNQLGSYNINSIEIIKGSNNSIYGAGTGGVMLIESVNEKEPAGIKGEIGLGSYGLQSYNAIITTASDRSVVKYSFQHQKSNGYRDHGKLQKSIASWNGLFKINKESILKATFLFGDLFYETPGALTRTEFKTNPRAARPATLSAPGAIQANAFIKQKMMVSGASYEQPVTSKIKNKTTLYGMFTELTNPNLRNYEKSLEPHFGARTVFKYQQSFKSIIFNVDGGGEMQQGFTKVNIHKNISGNADTLRSHDEINNQLSMIFLQTSVDIKTFTIITGASWNTFKVRFQRFDPETSGKQIRTFNNQVAPRFSLMKKFKQFNFYTSIAKGFSPPATAELLPTGGVINAGLNPENGTNYDIGFKGYFFKNFFADINLFTYSLNNAIVQRRDAAGGDYFVNAGKTRQHGVETLISYPLFSSSAVVKRSGFWVSYTLHDFHYKKFQQLLNDFSDKRLPSVPRNTVSTGFDLSMQNGITGSINYFYSDKIPLNDGNTEYADSYHLLGVKVGLEKLLNYNTKLKISLGADNLLNQHYSLGNDINAFGGRYYNAAPLRNFYLSVVLNFKTNKKNNMSSDLN